MVDFNDRREAKHVGAKPAECPACASKWEDANRLLNAKTQKVYGRVTTNTRKRRSTNVRTAKEQFDRIWKEHRRETTSQ